MLAEAALMQKPGELKKPLQPGSLQKEQRCPGCGVSSGEDHQADCTWKVAAAELRKPKAPREITDAEHQKWLREQGYD